MKGVCDMAKPKEKTIVSAVNKLNIAFQQKFENLGEVTINNTDSEIQLLFSVAEVADVEWTYGKATGLLKIRSTSHPQDLTEEELYDLGVEITEASDDITPTSYDDTLVFQAVYQLEEDDTVEVERNVFNSTMRFVQTLVNNRKKLRGKTHEWVGESEEEVDPEEQDEFGFDDFVTNEDGSLELVTENGTVSVEAAIGGEEKVPDEQVPEEELNSAPDDAEPSIAEEVSEDMAPIPENDELASMIEELAEDISSDSYNPDDYRDESVEETPAFYLPSTIVDLPNTEEIASKATAMRDTAKTYLDAINTRSRVLFADIDKLIDSISQAADQVHQTTQDVNSNLTTRSFQLQSREAKISEDMAQLEENRTAVAAQKAELDSRQESLEQRQMAVEKYAANLQVIDSRQKDIQTQLQNAMMENSDLRDKLETVQRQADESKAQIASMLEEGPNHSSYRSYVSDLRKKNAFQGKRITALDERVTTALAIIDRLQKENTGLRQREGIWQRQESEWKKKLAESNSEIVVSAPVDGVSAEQMRVLQEKISDMDQENTRLRDKADMMERDLDAERDHSNELAEQLKEAKTAAEAAQVERSKMEEELNSARLALTKAGALNDVALLASSVKEELVDIGIKAEVVPGEMEMIVGGTFKDVYEVHVDVANRIIYMEKMLKRAKKHKATIDALNEKDIRTTYVLQEDRVSCKAFCHNLDQSPTLILDIVALLDDLN